MQRITVSSDARSCCSDDLVLTRNSLAGYNPHKHKCQRCGKESWFCRKTATYRRGITFVRDGKRVNDECRIMPRGIQKRQIAVQLPKSVITGPSPSPPCIAGKSATWIITKPGPIQREASGVSRLIPEKTRLKRPKQKLS